MKIDGQFFNSSVGQLVVVAVVLVTGAAAVFWQHRQRQTPPLPAARPAAPAALPRTFTREGVRFPQKNPSALPPVPPASRPAALPVPDQPQFAPLTLFAGKQEPVASPAPPAPAAPFGRLIPCETIVTLESNRIETPVIGLVTENVWHDGRLVVPAGAEVHGRAALDRTRERIAVQGAWRIVWRTPDADNGTELAVEGLALDREFDAATRRWGDHDGSAGLRGTVLKTDNERELKLFAATFLAAATTALQDTRAVSSLTGETVVPAATVRNATLAGTGAVLQEYARQLREAIARDGFYVRVPAGKPFYLYVTQTLDRGRATHGNPYSTTVPTAPPHEN
jgi:hypothetical protein